MLELGLAFLVILALVGVMSVGVIFGRKPIKGTCGGMAALNMGSGCDICGGDTSKCDEESPVDNGSKAPDSRQLGYNAGGHSTTRKQSVDPAQ